MQSIADRKSLTPSRIQRPSFGHDWRLSGFGFERHNHAVAEIPNHNPDPSTGWESISNADDRGQQMKSIILSLLILLAHYQPAQSYSQDPRSCLDPRTQYPSYPPCHK